MLNTSPVCISCCFLNVHAVTLAALENVRYILSSAVAFSFLVVEDHALIRVVAFWFREGVGSMRNSLEGFATLFYNSDYLIMTSDASMMAS